MGFIKIPEQDEVIGALHPDRCRTAGAGPAGGSCSRGARAASNHRYMAKSSTTWEVRLFGTAGKRHISRYMAQLRALPAGGCALTVGTCDSLFECHKVGDPACLKHTL